MMNKTNSVLKKSVGLSLVLGGVVAAGSYIPTGRVTAQASAPEAKKQERAVISETLPKMDGGHLQVKVAEVSYGPGESSPPHSHPCPVVAVVVEGTIQTQVKGESEAIYKAGQAFYEAPNGVHMVSANADKTKPAKLLAYFVCDHETPVTVAVPEAKSAH